MRTFIIAVTCLSLGAGISHAKDIAEILGGIGKEPPISDTRAELQPIMDRMDVNGLQTTLVDYAHRAKVLQIKRDKDLQSKLKTSKIIDDLRMQIRACEAK